MKRKSIAALLLTAAAVAPAIAGAQLPVPCRTDVASAGEIRTNAVVPIEALVEAPRVIVCVNGIGYTMSEFVINADGTFSMPFTTRDLGNGSSFSLQSSGDRDPFVNFLFGSTVSSATGSITFDAFFSTGFVGGPYNTVSTTGGVTVSPAGIPGTVGTVSTGSYPAYISGYVNAVNAGVDIGTATCTATAPGSTTCTQPMAMGTIAPVTGPGTMMARLSYQHSTTGPAGTSTSSTVGWTGAFNLTATSVPEPATVGLMATGLVMIAGVGLRRRSA